MEDRVTALEIHLMHQEAALQELNEVVFRQQQELDRLSREVELLKAQLRAVAPTLAKSPADEEPPPHY